jgi:glutathione S-transferase
MPRPDLAAIGVGYRRIPVMAIGRDVYLDTRLIIEKLETLFPPSAEHPAISATTNDQKALERLLSLWAIDAGIFVRASQLIPTNMPVLQDPKFTKDREQMSGRSWSAENLEKNRPEAIADIKSGVALLENTLLADGRDWVLGTEKPSLADIEGKLLYYYCVSF